MVVFFVARWLKWCPMKKACRRPAFVRTATADDAGPVMYAVVAAATASFAPPPARGADDAGPVMYAGVAAAAASFAPPPGRGGARMPAAKAAAAPPDPWRQQMQQSARHARNTRAYQTWYESPEGQLAMALERQAVLEAERDAAVRAGTGGRSAADGAWARPRQQETTCRKQSR